MKQTNNKITAKQIKFSAGILLFVFFLTIFHWSRGKDLPSLTTTLAPSSPQTSDLANEVDLEISASAYTGSTTNIKNPTNYTLRDVFLVSDQDWHNVLPLIPVTTWTGQETWCRHGYGVAPKTCLYPTLIYHQEGEDFDAESILHFLQQYPTSRVFLVGATPTKLLDLIKQKSPDGGNIPANKIKSLTADNYLSFWRTSTDVVYVEDNYELSLLAATYASLINAPLIIKNGTDNSYLPRKNLICIGNTGTNCKVKYTLETLQKEYLAKTKTKRVILTNPNDLNISMPLTSQTPRFFTFSTNLKKAYTSDSLAAPILAAAKQELILTYQEKNYKKVDEFLTKKIKDLGINAAYLTIFSSPSSIEAVEESLVGDTIVHKELDNHLYGNLDNEGFQELSVGRIYGITPSDTSSLVARTLFYSHLPKTKKSMTYWERGSVKSNESINFASRVEDESVNEILRSINYDDSSKFAETDQATGLASSELKDISFFHYHGHGATTNIVCHNGNCPNSYELSENKIKLPPAIYLMEACLTCAYDKADDWGLDNHLLLICQNFLRRGAISYIGAVNESSSYFFVNQNVLLRLLNNHRIGEAFKDYKNMAVLTRQYHDNDGDNNGKDVYDPLFILLGDPTFNPKLPASPNANEVKNTLTQVGNTLELVIDLPVRSDVIQSSNMNYLKSAKSNMVLVDLKKLTGDMVDAQKINFAINVEKKYQIKSVAKVEFIDSQGNQFRLGFSKGDKTNYSSYWWSQTSPVYEVSLLGIWINRTLPNTDLIFIENSFSHQKDKIFPGVKYKITFDL